MPDDPPRPPADPLSQDDPALAPCARPDGPACLAHHRVVAALRESEARLRAVIASGEHGFYDVDPASGRVVFGAPCASLGYGEGEVHSVAEWRALIHPDHRARIATEFSERLHDPAGEYRSEYLVRAKSGEWRWILSRARTIAHDAEGRPARIAGTLTDVTESRRMQERLQAAERLASLGTLAAGIAHEINNPLSYILANLRELEAVLGDARPGPMAPPSSSARPGPEAVADRRELLAEAVEGAERVRNVVRQLGHLATPAHVLECSEVDVRSELEVALAITRKQIVHRARLAVELPPALPRVTAPPGQLGQVFVNLLVNAADALPEAPAPGGAEVRLAAEEARGGLAVTVSDTGSGIPRDVLPRIFDPFFTTKPFGRGTGLGLAISRGIVIAAGGRIEVESAEGQGTTFRVWLPAARRQAAAPRARPPTESPTPAAVRRVLVVDDEPQVARSIARLLGRAYQVTVATSGSEALRLVPEGRFEAVVCDLMMPDLSGMDLEERLRAIAPHLVPRVVYVTGGAFTERARAFLAQPRPYLEKPLDAARLRARVDAAAGAGLQVAG